MITSTLIHRGLAETLQLFIDGADRYQDWVELELREQANPRRIAELQLEQELLKKLTLEMETAACKLRQQR